MKIYTTLKISLLLLFLGLFACETEDVNTSSRTQDLYSTNDVNDPSFAAREFDCESPLRYKLTTWGGKIVGTAEAFIHDDQIVFEFCILGDLVKDWKILRTYLYIGTKAEWDKLTEGKVPTANEFPQIVGKDNITDYDPAVEGCVTVTKDLKGLDLEECFVWAAKVSFVSNSDSENKINTYAIIDEKSYTWDEELQIKIDDEICIQECKDYEVGTGTPGYWKNHPDAWPIDKITIGCETYTVEEAIKIMKTKKVEGDKSYDMFNHLAATILNVANGTNPDCIEDYIDAANEWMCEYGPVPGEVDASSEAWSDGGEDIKDMLDDYNNGRLCNEKRD